MGSCLASIKDTLSQAVFTPSSLIGGRGLLHMLQMVLCLVTFVVGACRNRHLHTYWNYAMFCWAFCPVLTLLITIIELFKLDVLLNMFCMDWDDFATGVAMSCALMTLSVAAAYANFYLCWKCVYAWVLTTLAFLCGAAYLLEVIKDKVLDRKKGSYLAALPGFWKVLEAFVSCLIFVSLIGHRGKPVLILCVVAYIIPFPIIPLIIVVNVLKKLRRCVPFNLDRFSFIFLAVSVGLYTFAAVAWPLITFWGNPRPSECPPSYCIWALEFMVAFFTYVNLGLFVVDLVFTLLGTCGFKRG